ncbi:Myb-like DNA-binding domain containing protein [Trichomonas vaginalis G3]|uniref:Myb-like DNA-binding domain containing protein n=1 Tax=Trichomonas vaginalis (strain ATCC PRA-98 / G3) TaxID=412133 RepID=A2E345_TRIV3|nr:RNA polymerase II transcription regulator recruiting protein [Trichomonas vaginalis G3]EAY12981.1 Myb-like DNA-binding domain containing protein [Trichomonas vaginalis G3]KAI5499804.1 RNA polymerase II transcription regulator recruiting protein [Trichomonas vaginalis G3]|eukprot:XP_001325204.1 Myb-like DNA-binding domain containing protein [Trichomonas vaginalis G3]
MSNSPQTTMVKPPRKPRQPFTQKEDEKLKQLVESLGDADWTIIARCMENRTPRQCRDRYKEYLMPSLNTSDWTPEEDNILRQKIKEYGKKWAIVCISLNGRSETSAKNRWRLLERRESNMKNEAKIAEACSSPDCYDIPPVQPYPQMIEPMYVPYFIPQENVRFEKMIQPVIPTSFVRDPLPPQPPRVKFPSLLDICPNLVCF